MATFTQLLRKAEPVLGADTTGRILELAAALRENDGLEHSIAARLAVEEELERVLEEGKALWALVEEAGGEMPRRPTQAILDDVFNAFVEAP